MVKIIVLLHIYVNHPKNYHSKNYIFIQHACNIKSDSKDIYNGTKK